MNGIKWFLAFALAFYVGLTALMVVFQRTLMYFPETLRTRPAQAGLPEAAEVELSTADTETVIAWFVEPRDADKPLVLHFHGNGGALRYRADRFRAIVADGTGLLALSYRGYAGSSGRPSEDGLIADALAAYQFAIDKYPARRIVLWGESLGAAVAIAVAAQKDVARLVLEAPFTSAVDVARRAYPILPVRWLMFDQFHSDRRVGGVKAPVLIIHGDRDDVVPIALGQRLFDLIAAPKRFVRLDGAGHNDLSAYGVETIVRRFLAERLD